MRTMCLLIAVVAPLTVGAIGGLNYAGASKINDLPTHLTSSAPSCCDAQSDCCADVSFCDSCAACCPQCAECCADQSNCEACADCCPECAECCALCTAD